MQAFSSALVDQLRGEWESLTALEIHRVGEWGRRVFAVADEYFDLRSRGVWVSGPGDLLGVLGLARAELTHSRLVAWLLNPEGKHAMGRGFMGRLLAECFPDLQAEAVRFRSIEVEVVRLETRADIVVWGDSATVVIETKVDAGEGYRQCDRLFDRFGDEPDARFVFLTPGGRPPLTATGPAADSFVSLSFSRLGDLLEDALGKGGQGEASDIARSYLRTLRKEFG